MRKRREDDLNVGEDSFLDTTANLVGILIILVMIVGAKARAEARAYGEKLASQDVSPLLEEPARQTKAILASLNDQKVKLVEYELENEYRKAERNRLLMQVKLAKEAIDEKLETLDESKRQTIEETQKIESLQLQLKDVQDQMAAADERERPTVVLEHLPTPMAQTVFNRELHVRLKGDRISVIPWDQLISMLKERAPMAVRRQTSREVLEDAIGPIGGWVAKYRMVGIPGGFELERLTLEDRSDVVSESLEEAFSMGGRLSLALAGRDPADTVITVWVYPDSFGTFRQMKDRLFQERFLCAARPLPAGMPIGASPNGSRSTAQ